MGFTNVKKPICRSHRLCIIIEKKRQNRPNAKTTENHTQQKAIPFEQRDKKKRERVMIYLKSQKGTKFQEKKTVKLRLHPSRTIKTNYFIERKKVILEKGKKG